MNVGNCTLVLTLLSRLDEIYFDQYGRVMERFADIQSIAEVIETPVLILFNPIFIRSTRMELLPDWTGWVRC